MITEKEFIGPNERAEATQKIIERAKENCDKYCEIVAAYHGLMEIAENKSEESIIAIGTDFLIKQI